MQKCCVCNKSIDTENEAHVVVPGRKVPGQHGLIRKKGSFQHEKCFSDSVIFNYESRKRDEEKLREQVTKQLKADGMSDMEICEKFGYYR